MKVKNLLTKMLFNKRQRMIIYQSLVFSAYKYRQRGNVDKAVEVQVVLNELSGKLGIVPETFTREQVDNIVDEISKKAQRDKENAYLAGIYEGKKNCTNDNENKPIEGGVLTVGTVINLEKCEKCDSKNNCLLYKAISEVEIEDNQEDAQEDSTEDKKEEEVNSDSTPSEETSQSESSKE